nr:immunoglobulin light chain junction region [Macaca mulatta]MOW65751.1 immunoglobulin light chain junction region [Macaca mulatta]
YMQDIQFPLSF